VYTYDAMAQQATSEQFQEGLLLPGQSLVVDRTIRLLGPREEIIVAYGELTELDVRRELYFAARDSGIRTKYRRPDDAALREFAALGPRTPNVGTGPGRESVLATQPLMTRPGKTATQAVDFAGAKSPPLVWAEAEKRGRGRFLTYCVTFGGWVFAGDGGDVVVGATGDRSLPSAPARLYRDLDLDHKFTLRVDEKSARELGVKAQPGDGMYRQGLFAEVTAAESPRVLEAARAAGRRIELQRYFFDRYFYSLR